MLNVDGLDFSHPVFVCGDRNGGDAVLVRFIDDVFDYVQQCLLGCGLDTRVLCGDLRNEWRDYQRDYLDLEQENEQPMTPYARRNHLIRLAMIVELLTECDFKVEWVGGKRLRLSGGEPVDMTGFALVLKGLYTTQTQVVDLGREVCSMLTPEFADELKKEFGRNIFDVPTKTIGAQARAWQLLDCVSGLPNITLPEKPVLMFALLKDFVETGPHKGYPGLSELYRTDVSVDRSASDVMNSLYTRHCMSEAMRYNNTIDARARVSDFVRGRSAQDTMLPEYTNPTKTVQFYGIQASHPLLVAYYLVYAVAAGGAKYNSSFRNDILASQGWLLCRLFAHRYPNVRVSGN